MTNHISKMLQDICSVRNAVPRTDFSEVHLVKPGGIKNGILACPQFLVSLSLVPDDCQLQDLLLTPSEQSRGPHFHGLLHAYHNIPDFCGDIALTGRHEDVNEQ